ETTAPFITPSPTATPSPAVSPAPAEKAAPEKTAEPEPEPELLGSAETKLADRGESRMHNIKLAAAAINGCVLAPGESFSFNGIVGDRTPERGYKDAAVIVKKEKKEGCGGGVCQVSTTVYQAAKAAGLTILERNSHQKEVSYAGQGHDAAVNYGSLDMRFRNNTQSSIKILVSVGRRTVSASVYRLP
ncbi:MAG: VanW family protein, partial [Clostridia bacterium]